MRILIPPTVLLTWSALSLQAPGAAPPDGTRPIWPGQRHAAIALTYDDALASQLDVAIPQLDAAGLKGTFFLTGRQVGDQVPRWRAAARSGHELGNHTVNHPCARGSYDMPEQYTSEAYTVGVLMTEIRVMNGFLQALDDKPAHAFATPCGQNLAGGADYLVPLQEAVLASYIRDTRTLPGSVQATGFSDTSGAEMIRWVENTRRAGLAGVVVFHGVGGDYLSVSGEAHQQLVAYLKAHEREIWTATFSDVMRAATPASSPASGESTGLAVSAPAQGAGAGWRSCRHVPRSAVVSAGAAAVSGPPPVAPETPSSGSGLKHGRMRRHFSRPVPMKRVLLAARLGGASSADERASTPQYARTGE